MFLENSLYLHGLNLLPQFGPAHLSKLWDYFGSYKTAYLADVGELVQAGVKPEIAQLFIQFRPKINLEQEAEKLARSSIGLLSFLDSNYPKLLLEIPKFPPLLYFRGSMQSPDELCISVVGTRKITNYGRMATTQLAEPLADAGAVIVSGMAFGVDAAAHEIAVKKHKRTIAVLGGGLDEASLYPRHHGFLAQQILDNGGALLSEYPIATPNYKQNFVARNRIISGLSLATLIIECDLESGTLITARHALDQNRTVFAVPGPIYSPQSQGPNNLLKMGAKPATRAEDILQDLNLQALPEQQKTQELFGDSPAESAILKILNYEPRLADDIIKLSGLEASAVTTALTFLEMKGKIKNLGGQQYVLAR